MNANANQLLDLIAAAVRGNLPPGITPAYLDGFLRRHRPTLVSVLERNLATRRRRQRPRLVEAPPEEWTPSRRTAANLAAMRVAASTAPNRLTADNRKTLGGYSGWGGLSIAKVASKLPTGFPVPETRGLIHEYYTPTKVTDEVARVLRPLLPELAGPDGTVLTLEPSAGIGRFVRSLSGPGFESLRWNVIEWSDLSARMLQAIRPDLTVYNGPFERWIREHGDEFNGRLNLVVANPPYGLRGASVTEDPVRAYREKQAYAYFLRRALDLLAPGGLGVFLVPAGFLTGRGARSVALRERVLKRHHLSAAYRLPSKLFPGANLVTDLLFLRSFAPTATNRCSSGRSSSDRQRPRRSCGASTAPRAGRLSGSAQRLRRSRLPRRATAGCGWSPKRCSLGSFAPLPGGRLGHHRLPEGSSSPIFLASGFRRVHLRHRRRVYAAYPPSLAVQASTSSSRTWARFEVLLSPSSASSCRAARWLAIVLTSSSTMAPPWSVIPTASRHVLLAPAIRSVISQSRIPEEFADRGEAMGERWPMGLALAWVTGCGPPLEGNWTGECRADDDFELEFDLQEEDTDTRYAGDGTATWPDGESLPLTISINLCRGAPVCHTLMGDIEPGEASVWIGIESWGTIETVADKAGRSLRGKCTFANDLILRKRAFSG